MCNDTPIITAGIRNQRPQSVHRSRYPCRVCNLDSPLIAIEPDVLVAKFEDVRLCRTELEGQQPGRLGVRFRAGYITESRAVVSGASGIDDKILHAVSCILVFCQIDTPFEAITPFAAGKIRLYEMRSAHLMPLSLPRIVSIIQCLHVLVSRRIPLYRVQRIRIRQVLRVKLLQ